MYSHLQFKIDQLRKEKMILAIESIAVFIFSLFLSIFLPQLLYTYFYADQQLMAEPKLLTYIPVISFIIGMVYFLYMVVMNISKAAQVKKLEAELTALSEDTLNDDDLAEVQKIVDEIVAEEKPRRKTATKTKRVKKTVRK